MSLCSGMCLPAGVTLLKLASVPLWPTTSAPVHFPISAHFLRNLPRISSPIASGS